jgi:hypothetical protein
MNKKNNNKYLQIVFFLFPQKIIALMVFAGSSFRFQFVKEKDWGVGTSVENVLDPNLWVKFIGQVFG